MQFRIIAALLIGLLVGQAWAQDKGTAGKAAQPKGAGKAAQKAANGGGGQLQTLKEKASYTIGMNLGSNLSKQGIDIDVEIMARGIKDAMAGGKMLLTEEEAEQVMQAFTKELIEKQQAKAKVEGAKNQKESTQFLAENKKKEGVKETKSGLQYKVLKPGTGKKPTEGDRVTVNYKGTLINGKVFDSSYDRGEPITFDVDGVIPGWTEALKMMPVGSKWQLFIPPDLAYGEQGAGTEIGPNSTLIFEVELLGIDESNGEGISLPQAK